MHPIPPTAARSQRTTKVVAVVDVVQSVRMMEEDEAGFVARWQSFVAFARAELPRHRGCIHKSLGDGLMLLFEDPSGCLHAALAMQGWLMRANRHLRWEQKLQLRVGAHIADFVRDELDIYGNGVNLTSRITEVAGPGEIVVSAALRERLVADTPAELQDLGPCHLKHVARPVRLFRVQSGSQERQSRALSSPALAANDECADFEPGPASRYQRAGSFLRSVMRLTPSSM